MVRAFRRLGLIRHLPLIQRALKRRRSWPNRQACFEQYRSKAFFANWSDPALWAYVQSATRLRDDGTVELVYPPEWEAHIFATMPTDVWGELPRLSVPALVIRGGSSPTFRPEAARRMARHLPGASFVTIPHAGHLVPMERPAETAEVILGFLTHLHVAGAADRIRCRGSIEGKE